MVAARTGPAEAAAAAASGGVAFVAVAAVAAAETAEAEPARRAVWNHTHAHAPGIIGVNWCLWRLTVSTVLSPASGAAQAAPADRVVRGSLSARRRPSAVWPEAPGRTGCQHRQGRIIY